MLATCYGDSGHRLNGHVWNVVVDGRSEVIHGSISHAFVVSRLPNLNDAIQPLPPSLPISLMAPGKSRVHIIGWLRIECLDLGKSGDGLTLPRGTWHMNCLVTETGPWFEDVVIATTGLEKWQVLDGGQTLHTYGDPAPPFVPVPGNDL